MRPRRASAASSRFYESFAMTQTTQATPAVQVPAHVEAMEALARLARLADALAAADAKLCWAIKNSRDCGLPELEQGLVGLQAQFDVLVARLRPVVTVQPASGQPPAKAWGAGGPGVWSVSHAPACAPGEVALRIEATTPEGQALLGDVDTWGHKPVQVVGRERTPHRDPASGGYPTTSVTLLLTR